MAEIKINVANLDNAIEALKSLRDSWSAHMIKLQSMVGGGAAASEMENIAQVYRNLHSSMQVLISNTISFLENARQSYQSSDEDAAAKIQGN